MGAGGTLIFGCGGDSVGLDPAIVTDGARFWVDDYSTPPIYSKKISGYVPQPVGHDLHKGVVLEQ